ncbi:MAG: rhodanese-like domain-containing protein [Burkholderiales bacterium]
MENLSAHQLADWLEQKRPNLVLLDVREPWEWELCRIENSLHIPMGQVPARLNEMDHDAEIVCICHHGARSAQVGFFLERNGFERVYNLSGGVHAWAEQINPTMARY